MLAGVTSTIAAIDSGYAYVNDETMEYARKRGTAVHLACELHDRKDLDEDSLHPEIRPYLQAYRMFLFDTGFKVELIEERMRHPALGYAGQLDRTGKLGFRKVLLDIKAVAAIQVATRIQIAAYKELCRANGMRDIDESRALQLRPDGTYRLSSPYVGGDDLKVFTSLLTINNWKQKNAN